MTTTTVLSFTFEEVGKRVKSALNDFREQDLQLLELCVDKRAATHRIACYLQNYFPDWHVDCEYNRKGRNQKTLEGELVIPDIIIHRREKENLLCIEAKKDGISLKDDRNKLCGFTKTDGEFGYQFGLLIILSLDKPFDINLEWYKNGRQLHDYADSR